MEDLKSLGRFIATKRKRLHLTQEQLAVKMHVSKSAIGKWETDGGVPDRNNLYNLAETFDVPVELLYRYVTNEEEHPNLASDTITAEIIAVLEKHGYKVTGPQG